MRVAKEWTRREISARIRRVRRFFERLFGGGFVERADVSLRCLPAPKPAA